MKKLISLLLSVVMLLSLGVEAFSAYEGEKVRAYESADCTIVYNITNEWTGNQQVSVTVTNNSDETLRNWALKLNSIGTITNIWNAEVLQNDGELCVIRNNGYNYELISGETVEFGFMQQGDSLYLPESISLCSKTADSTACVEVSYEIQNNWGHGFIAAVTVKNISDEPLEAWKLSFNGNFEISSIWNANLLYTGDSSFKVENDITTTPIAVGETKTFGFQGVITSGEEPVMLDFKLTSVVIDAAAAPDDSGEEDDSDETGETTEAGDSGETTEPEDPVEPEAPEETEDPIILSFGEYFADENALEVYWYSNIEGAVSVYENTNNNGWLKLTEVTDEDSYKYEITEEFLVKYIKVSQETESGTIESEPFIVTLTEDGYVCTWLDTDEDGLPDFVEEMYGTDPEKTDTDDDGLSDYDELYTVGTSPLKYDTDEDGTNDADSDTDGDGLTNAQELDLGTSPSSADTDGDSLSDYSELYETNTDPLKADTDGDTLSDSDDIALGLDPNDPETFGVPDAEYKVEQTISADSEVMDRINTEEAPYELSLEITASGNAATNLIAGSSIYSAITESSARLGGAVDLSYLSGEVDKVKLVCEVGESYIPNDGSEYAANCVDLQGIKRYNIFRYFEDVNMLLPVATEFDEENNTLYAETDELGTYCVLDMEILLQNLGIEPDGTQTGTVMQEFYSAAMADASTEIVPTETEESTSSTEEPVNVTFILDIRSDGLTNDEFESVKSEIDSFAKRAFLYDRNVVIQLVTQNTTDFLNPSYEFIGEYDAYNRLSYDLSDIDQENQTEASIIGDHCNITEALEAVIVAADLDVKNYIFDVYAQNNAIYEYNKAYELANNAWANNITIGLITEYEGSFAGYQSELLTASRGVVYNRFTDFSDNIYSLIWLEEDIIPTESFPVFLGSGYKWIELDSKLYPNGYWQGLNPNADTDGDGLTDWNEVMTRLLKFDGTDYTLPTIGECVEYLGSIPFYVNTALFTATVFERAYWDQPVLPIYSDPSMVDSDGDELSDPLEKKIGSERLKADTDGDGLNDGLEFVEGFDLFNRNPDGDDWSDYEEYHAGTDPRTYDKNGWDHFAEWAGYVGNFTDGFFRGDFIQDPEDLATLCGVLVGSCVPGIDIRDAIANLVHGDYLFAGLSFISLIPVAGDITKAVNKICVFIRKNADNVDEIAGALKFTQNTLPEVFDGMKYTDEYVYAIKTLPSREAAELFDSEPALQKILKIGANSTGADEVIAAYNRINSEDNLKLFKQYVQNTNAADIADYEKGYQKLVNGVSGFKRDFADFISGMDEATAFRVLDLSSKYGESMLKAIKVCGVDNTDTIADYVKIFDKFGGNADEIVENCLVKKFIGLDEALTKVHGEMMCFTRLNDECIVTVSNISLYNPTISTPINYIPSSYVNRTDQAAKTFFYSKYDELLSQNFLDKMCDTKQITDEVAAEYQKLIDAVKQTRIDADGYNNLTHKTGITDDWSFEAWPVTNCAEVWGAREMILRGAKFDNLKDFLACHVKDGVICDPCQNCVKTFGLSE